MTDKSDGVQGSVSVTIPLTLSISLGHPAPTTPPPAPMIAEDDLIAADTEAPESFANRDGYLADFIGSQNVSVPLPKVTKAAADMLTFDQNGVTETELRYEHFSVVMNRPRRMCFFSAVNIDGGKTKKVKRTGWRFDPRIPRDAQIMKECYGSPPKFSRGHMTRRNDPSWGSATVAKRGNRDSMHVTNATPQMQAFNSPIWLELEDYALENAKEDDMRISVFTGPFFRADDPAYYGVAVPVSFWKVIAFIHDDTGKLSATGYRMNQSQSLPSQTEFVFGDFTSTRLGVAAQVPISQIEAEAGIDFGPLSACDPLGAQESIGGAGLPLMSRTQIRFV